MNRAWVSILVAVLAASSLAAADSSGFLSSDSRSAETAVFAELCPYRVVVADTGDTMMVEAPADAEVPATPEHPPMWLDLDAGDTHPVLYGMEVDLNLPEPSLVHLAIYDLLGREITVLADGTLEAGCRTVDWHLSRMGALRTGIYQCRADGVGIRTHARYRATHRLLVIC